jgi:hypothetical protein
VNLEQADNLEQKTGTDLCQHIRGKVLNDHHLPDNGASPSQVGRTHPEALKLVGQSSVGQEKAAGVESS